MADQTCTRFGALDSRLAAAVRHALDVAVTFTALAPLNDVHRRLSARARSLNIERAIPDPPSHKWYELMTELFGRDSEGAAQHIPVGLVTERFSAATLSYIRFARSYKLNPSERYIIRSILAESGALIIAESITLSDGLRRSVDYGRDPLGDDALNSNLQRAGHVGMTLVEHAAAENWWNFLPYQDRHVPAIPLSRFPTAVPARQNGFGLPISHNTRKSTSRAPQVDANIQPAASRFRRSYRKPVAAAVACLALAIGLLVTMATQRPLDQVGKMVMPLEKPDLKLSIMTTTDLGPFWLAVQKGYFREEGFTFDPTNDVKLAESGTQSVAMLEDKVVDIAYATYPPFIAMQSKGKDTKLIAAASLAGPGSCMVVAMPDSKIKSVADMTGARVAITAPNTVSQLMVQSALEAYGVDHKTVQWVAVPFEGMEERLVSGEVDAAFMVEPFLSRARNNIGTAPVFDTAVKRTYNLPTAGFGVNAEFVSKYPRTAAAFQRVMQRATAEANADRATVEPALVQFAHLDTSTAKLPSLLTFQSSLNASEIQQVADLMVDFDMIDRSINVSTMIARIPGGR